MPRAANPATQGVVSAALADTDTLSAPLVSYLKRLRHLDETASGLTGSIKRLVDAKLEEAREGTGKRARGDGASKNDLSMIPPKEKKKKSTTWTS
jgi:hypothetical protein